MNTSDNERITLNGPKGSLPIQEDDDVAIKLAMLFEGECTALGPLRAAEKYGYTKQRYYQLRAIYFKEGSMGLKNKKTGPKTNYQRTDEIVRQVICHKFLDSDVSTEVVTQKLQQCGHTISKRSVERIIEDYGLQKKNYIYTNR